MSSALCGSSDVEAALALFEFSSVAAGIAAADTIVKRAPLEVIYAGTVQPGHYLVLVTGAVASVEEAVMAANDVLAASLIDQVFLPAVDPDVVKAIRCRRLPDVIEALGVIETVSVAASIEAADAGVKGADVSLVELRIADGLGGKGYVLFAGSVSNVEAAVEVAASRIPPGALVGTATIPQLHAEIAENIIANGHFATRIGRGGDDAAR